ncbi:hypothetical protein [Mesorhizobium sp.]|uniref:hypothetical protein n=1 Tax=Mesorhizobium sp. TaxID=1871066 RepID=UPI000FE4BB0B|nr:hypothetical protein [Mesorhizobium sp.]RWK81030.1 MAG: hypothetical protein EOR51_16410 [Mesorhizobium sp.]RWL08351.1 MAG: hypothetical protein EOR55_04125 [Mesorhizobium sp.]RWL12150.1 MAG: hypothetical protein EOR56_15075 [Mesorhizobium sp.]
MSRVDGTSSSRTEKSGRSITRAKNELESGDLEAFNPSPPNHKIDDKAAQLEEEIQAIKVEAKRVYFVLSFIATAFFLLFVASVGNRAVIAIAIAASLILLIGIAKWLEFPWVVLNLERWHDMFFKACERWIGGKKPPTTEPVPDQE